MGYLFYMKTKSKLYKLLGILALAIVILLTIFLLGKNDKILELNQTRILSDNLKLLETIDAGKKVSLIKEFNDSIYFVSWSKNNQGILFNLITNKENNLNVHTDSLLIGDYFIETDNNLVVHNKLKNELLKIDASGKLYNFEKMPIRISRLYKNDSIYLLTDWDKNYKFRRFKFNPINNNLKPLEFKDEYFNEYDLSGIALDGFFYDNEHFIVNLPFSLNCAYVFNKSFDLVKRVDFIYNKNEFNYQVTSQGQLVLDSNNIHPNLSGAVDSRKLYVLVDAGTTSKRGNKYYIDIYNIESGQYIESYEVEKFNGNKPSYFIIKENHMYLSFGEYVNKYQLLK